MKTFFKPITSFVFLFHLSFCVYTQCSLAIKAGHWMGKIDYGIENSNGIQHMSIALPLYIHLSERAEISIEPRYQRQGKRNEMDQNANFIDVYGTSYLDMIQLSTMIRGGKYFTQKNKCYFRVGAGYGIGYALGGHIDETIRSTSFFTNTEQIVSINEAVQFSNDFNRLELFMEMLLEIGVSMDFKSSLALQIMGKYGTIHFDEELPSSVFGYGVFMCYSFRL